MTLQLRPTFSESWYRVKNLRARLRSGAQISRQYYRGDRWYVVRDPAGNQFHRLSDPAYRFVGLLDGSRTVEEAWDLAGGQLADDAPTQPEVIQILSHLYSANLVDADVTPDATVLLRRHKQLSKRKMQNRMMNVLFPRIPLWDPDRFLQRWMPLVRLMFSKFGAVVWLAVITAALIVLAPHWDTPGHSLKESAQHAIDVKSDPVNLVLLWGTFVLIKAIHELGHAFSCRRFGGECHELGIMFLVFIPTPYVDASTAWQFPNKWQRIFVGAAGMIVELFVASLCAFVWVMVDPDHLIGKLMFNAMLVASVTTIIFNANPLLRYDGYYILSDFLEIPNLRQKSSEYALGLIKRHLFRVKLQQPLPPLLQRFWLLGYAILSGIYRTFVGIAIILLVAFQIPVLGILMAVGGVVTWVAVPAFKTFKYLAVEPELHRKRGRATAYTVAFVVSIVVLVGLIKFPLHLDTIGVLEPAQRAMVRAAMPGGFVSEVVAKDRQWVKGPVYQRGPDGKVVWAKRGNTVRPVILEPGDPILICKSGELDAQLREANAALAESLHKQSQAVASNEDPTVYDRLIQGQRENIEELKAEKEELTIRAPISGQIMSPDLHEMEGRFLAPGQEVALIAQNKDVIVRTLMEQKDMEVVTQPVLKTEVRPAGDIRMILLGGQARELGESSTTDIPAVLTAAAGGSEVQNDPKHPEKAATPQFNIAIPLENPNEKLVLGQRAYIRFTLDKKPLVWQWTRRFLQLIQQKSASSPWI